MLDVRQNNRNVVKIIYAKRLLLFIHVIESNIFCPKFTNNETHKSQKGLVTTS